MKHLIEITPSKPQDITLEVTEDSEIFVFGTHGGALNLHVDIQKDGISATIHGIIVGMKNSAYEIKTMCRHSAPQSSSRFLLKTVLADASMLNFEGMIRIEKKAQLSDAYLKNENLLLGETARANSSPQLEILADDVKASHGVSISPIDAEQAHYLMSRGITPNEAQKVLVKGFLGDVLRELSEQTQEILLSSLVI